MISPHHDHSHRQKPCCVQKRNVSEHVDPAVCFPECVITISIIHVSVSQRAKQGGVGEGEAEEQVS